MQIDPAALVTYVELQIQAILLLKMLAPFDKVLYLPPYNLE
jgi:hypothetical protein